MELNRKEQIEKMTNDLCVIQNKGMKCTVCKIGCECHMLAEALYEAGYRKASEVEQEIYDRLSDTLAKEVEGWKKYFESLYETAKATLRAEVAKEIFAELKTVMIDEWRYPIIAELKKKYLEGEDEN